MLFDSKTLLHSRYNLALPVIMLVGVIDLVWNARLHVSFNEWLQPTATLVALSLIGTFYSRVRPFPPLAELTFYGVLWVSFTILGSIQTYLAASASYPLADAALASFDAFLGFDWMAWVRVVRADPVLNILLRASYISLLPQIVGSIFLFVFARVQGRNEQFLLSVAIALLLTSFISARLPALGPWVHFAYGAMNSADTAYVADILALRRGDAPPFALSRLQGIVCCPSFHTVLAIIFVYMHRGIRWSLPPIVVLNATMLLSLPSEGGHYIADIFAGVLVAFLALGIAHLACRARGTLLVASRNVAVVRLSQSVLKG